MAGELTKHQRQCLEHLRQAEALGMSLTEYAQAHGVKVRMLYDAVVHFRRTGMMAKAVKGAGPRRPRVERLLREEQKSTALASPFVAVRIEPDRTPFPVLRLQHVGGHVLEFGAWPAADFLKAILTEGRDAAS